MNDDELTEDFDMEELRLEMEKVDTKQKSFADEVRQAPIKRWASSPEPKPGQPMP